jgi:hypothetical protein
LAPTASTGNRTFGLTIDRRIEIGGHAIIVIQGSIRLWR